MFESLKSLGKAVIGLTIETPIAIVTDVLTICGALTNRYEPDTKATLRKALDNPGDAIDTRDT